MKNSYVVRLIAVAAAAVVPFMAHGAERGEVQACIKAFTAEQFPAQSATVKIEGTYNPVRLPLIAFADVPKVKLVATDADTGRKLAVATCDSKNGIVTVAPVTKPVAAQVAAR